MVMMSIGITIQRQRKVKRLGGGLKIILADTCMETGGLFMVAVITNVCKGGLGACSPRIFLKNIGGTLQKYNKLKSFMYDIRTFHYMIYSSQFGNHGDI